MALGDSPYQDVLGDISTVIGYQGYPAALYQAVLCPCGNSPGAAININCAACHGLGLLYPNPPVSLTVMVSDPSQQTDMMDQGYGLAQEGELTAYPDPKGPRLSTFDLLMFPVTASFPTYSDSIERGTGSTDEADYNIAVAEGAWTVDPTTGVATAYTPGTDFTAAGKTITWGANAPKTGQMYSLRYAAQFEWVAYDPPTPRLVFGQDLGQIVTLRKRHVVFQGCPSPIGA